MIQQKIENDLSGQLQFQDAGRSKNLQKASAFHPAITITKQRCSGNKNGFSENTHKNCSLNMCRNSKFILGSGKGKAAGYAAVFYFPSGCTRN